LIITARHIADFLDSLQQEEAMQAQLMGAAEGKQVLALINTASVASDPTPPGDPGRTEAEEGGETAQPPDTQPVDQPLDTLEDYPV
jgi:hypothetical protein